MKPLIRAAVRLYPGRWRQRYGPELEALIDDIEPGWAELSDLVYGAIVMQIKRVASIPVFCAVAGALLGVLLVTQTSKVYASSATIRFKTAETSSVPPRHVVELRSSLERNMSPDATTREVQVTVGTRDGEYAMATLSYRSPDPAQAQRIAQRLSNALVADIGAEILATASVPQTPLPPDYEIGTTVGGLVGLGVGTIAACIALWRRKK